MAGKKSLNIDIAAAPAAKFITMEPEAPAAPVSSEDHPGTFIVTQPAKPESRSKRIPLMVTPALSARLKAEAIRQGVSVNELINQILNFYV